MVTLVQALQVDHITTAFTGCIIHFVFFAYCIQYHHIVHISGFKKLLFFVLVMLECTHVLAMTMIIEK